jgi:hypothetical protein
MRSSRPRTGCFGKNLSHDYAAARDRIGILVETHSWATNEQRVRTMHDFIAALFERAVTDAPAWRAAADAADAVKGTYHAEARDLPAGSLFVPIAQPRARLLMHLFEPLAPDSLVAWGFFNVAFQQQEYMEAYVAEEEARKMLAASPALKAEFEARLADPAFAASLAERLRFFYRRHPAWDERVNLVPIVRVGTSPIDAGR